MSTWRALGAMLTKAAQGLAHKMLGMYGQLLASRVAQQAPKVLIKSLPKQTTAVPWRRVGAITRMLWRSSRGGTTAARAAAMGFWHSTGRPSTSWRTGHNKYLIHRDQRNNNDLINHIHRIFAPTPATTSFEVSELPREIAGYEIDENIAVGCNGAVYEARALPKTTTVDHNVVSLTSTKTYDSTNNENTTVYPLVVKMLFNYNWYASPTQIWRDNEAEMVPVRDTRLHGHMRWLGCRPTPKSHPNIVALHTAFVDRMPILPNAERLYPAALPPIDALIGSRVTPLHTMFLVLKRYTMTLREYLLSRQPSTLCGQIMFGQLLEAITFLHASKISHRDLKSDNILVDFNQPDEPPSLVVTDFGSCLSGGSLRVPYPSDDIDLGGNVVLRPPEIRRARPGQNVVLDYAMADLWASATLAYEIFTRVNPFYSTLKSDSYDQHCLPALPAATPYPVKRLVAQMLRINPDMRPSPSVAATTVILSLFRVDISSCVEQLHMAASHKLKNVQSLVRDFLGLFAVETLLATNRTQGRAESTLRQTFLARVNAQEVVNVLNMYYLPVSPNNSGYNLQKII